MQGDADTHEADGLMGGVGDTAPLTPAENEPADIEGGYPSQGTSALEAEAKAKIKSLALQGAEDKAKPASKVPEDNETEGMYPAPQVNPPYGNLALTLALTPTPTLYLTLTPTLTPTLSLTLTPTLSLILTLTLILTQGDDGELVSPESVPPADVKSESEELGEDAAVAALSWESHRRSLRAASMLAQITERAFLEHQLAARHFSFLNFCEHMRPPGASCIVCRWCRSHSLATDSRIVRTTGLYFVPLNIMIAATSVLSFMGGDPEVSGEGKLLSHVDIIVGCIAAFSVFCNSCDRFLNYKSRADMHAGARQLCKELLANIDFILVKYQAEDGQAEPLDEQTIKDIKTKRSTT